MRSTLLRLLPSVTFAFAMRSLTPTNYPLTYSIPVVIKPLITFLLDETSSERFEDFVAKVVFRVADGECGL